jgi:hypothetical protein
MSVLFLTGSVLLLVAGVGHGRRRATLAATLSTHRLVPLRLVPAMSLCVVGTELAVGVSGAFAAVRWQTGGVLPVTPALAQAALYLLFLSYLIALMWLRPGSDCGCSHRNTPVNALTVGRAAILAGAALTFPALGAAEAASISLSGLEVVMTWLCSGILVAALSVVPHALPGVPALQSKVG